MININEIPFRPNEVTRYHLTDDPTTNQLCDDLAQAEMDFNAKSEESEEFESSLQVIQSHLESLRDDLEADCDGESPLDLIEHNEIKKRYQSALDELTRIIDSIEE